MVTLITILDAITETSMPFNEFVLYRANHYKEERQVLIVCGAKKPLPQVTIPDNLSIFYAGRNLYRIRKTVSREIATCEKNKEKYAIHLHHNKSSVLSQIAMMGTGFSKKTLFTVHSTFSGYEFHNKALSFIGSLFSNSITCVSKASFNDYPSFIKKIKKNRIKPLQNGVDIERIEKNFVKYPVEHPEVVFVYVARMIPLKNHDFLINVIKKVGDRAKFYFIGAKDNRIVERIKNEGIEDKVVCLGLIPRNEVFLRLQESDVYLSTSTLEGLPISVLEGMYSGLPAILSNIVQHKEVGGNGKIVQLLPFEEDQWVSCINTYLEMSKEEISRLGCESKMYVKQNFSLESMHYKYDEIYYTLRNK